MMVSTLKAILTLSCSIRTFLCTYTSSKRICLENIPSTTLFMLKALHYRSILSHLVHSVQAIVSDESDSSNGCSL